MQVKILNKDLAYLYAHGKEKGSPQYPPEVAKAFVKKVKILQQAENTQMLRQYKSLHFEELKGDLKGSHSVRVNDQYRIVLKIEKEDNGTVKIEIVIIEDLVDYH